MVAAMGLGSLCNPPPTGEKCGGAACSPPNIRTCIDKCQKPLNLGDLCSRDPCDTSKGGVCGPGLGCSWLNGAYRCWWAMPTGFGCDPQNAYEPCEIGAYCRDLSCFPNSAVDRCSVYMTFNQQCDSNWYQAAGCYRCEPGTTCTGGYCKKNCEGSSDCPCPPQNGQPGVGGYTCSQGTCCIQDGDFCDSDGDCCNADSVCGSDHKCGPCKVKPEECGCNSDKDCCPGKGGREVFCDPHSHACRYVGYCGDSCNLDSECAPGTHCDKGTCQRDQPCPDPAGCGCRPPQCGPTPPPGGGDGGGGGCDPNFPPCISGSGGAACGQPCNPKNPETCCSGKCANNRCL